MENEVMLITLVENYEELYNLKHTQYANQQRRDYIWNEIGNIINLPAKTCRERWTRIRDNHRKALNLRKTKGSKKMKAPKYDKELTFLIPYLFDEETRNSSIASPVNLPSPHSSSETVEEEVLITLVEDYEELYNLNHNQYTNQQRRDKIWEEIGNTMNLPARRCRERWARIRENHRKALTLRKTKMGSKKMKAPKYDKELTFLVPYLFDEESTRSSSPTNLPSSSDLDEMDTDDDDHSQSMIHASSPTIFTSSSGVSSISNTNRRKRKFVAQPPSTASVLKEYLDKRCKSMENANQTIETARNDALTQFFLTMAETVKEFPVIDQIQIKAKLFEMVNSVEMKIANCETTENAIQQQQNVDVAFPKYIISNQSTDPLNTGALRLRRILL